jgi:integrase
VEQAVKADGTVGLPKSGQARAAFLPRRTAWTLRWWAERSPFTALEDLVFFGHRPDEPLNRKTISKRFGPALEAAGIERGERYLTAHSLRHTWVTRCRRLFPEALVQYMAGHRGRLVGERYTHLGPADRLRAILPAPPDLGRAWE